MVVPVGWAFVVADLVAVAGYGLHRLARDVRSGRPLPELTASTYSTFEGVAGEAPRAFRGFAVKFTVTFLLLAAALLALGPQVVPLLERAQAVAGAVLWWPAAWPGPSFADYIFVEFVALFLTLAFVVGLEFEAIRASSSERLRPLVFLAGYLLLAPVADAAIAPYHLPAAYTIILRGAVGGPVYAIALFSVLGRPRPLLVAPVRRDRSRPVALLLSAVGAVVAAALLTIYLLYPVWHHLPSPWSSIAFLILLPTLAYTLFGALGLLSYRLVTGREERALPGLETFHPRVSVVIPAYNEERTLPRTLRQLDAAVADYPGEVEILVGNDGSTDATGAVARATLAGLSHARGRCLDLVHGGKSSALNGALLAATGEVVVRVDADTLVQRLGPIVRHFADPEMGEVQGRIVPARRTGWIAKLRLVEVMWNHAFFRRALLATGTLQVLSGNFCAFHRRHLLAAGGWVPWNGEDAEISIRFQRLGYKMRMELDALALEDTPSDLPALTRQRIRWNRGGYFSHAYHFGALFAPPGNGGGTMYLWGLRVARGLRNYLIYAFAALLTIALASIDLFRVLVILGLLYVPRVLVTAGYLVRWGYARDVGWALAWPPFGLLKAYFSLEAFGTMLPGNTPEFSD